jgi:hypothetical protein
MSATRWIREVFKNAFHFPPTDPAERNPLASILDLTRPVQVHKRVSMRKEAFVAPLWRTQWIWTLLELFEQ